MYEFDRGWRISEVTITRGDGKAPDFAVYKFAKGDERVVLRFTNPKPIEKASLFWEAYHITVRDLNQEEENSLEYGRYILQSWDNNYEACRITADNVEKLN